MVLAPQIPFLSSPATIVNQALDALGQPGKIIGDLTDGSVVSEAARRNYGQILRSLLRTAHWNFARKQAELQLLADATGQSSAPVVTYVDHPWTYAYAWPIDGVAVRWMPASHDYSTTGSIPATTVPGDYRSGAPLIPTRFLVSSSDQYPLLIGDATWAQMPDFQRTQGAGPLSRRIILTDNPNSKMVYTRLVTTIEEWDPLFRAAMVSAMQVMLAPVAIDEPKLREVERDKALSHLKTVIDDARVANGNDAGYPQSIDSTPSWIRARSSGWAAPGFGNGAWGGDLYCGWESFSISGSVF